MADAKNDKIEVKESKRQCDLKKSQILAPFISPCSKRPSIKFTQGNEKLMTKRLKYGSEADSEDKATETLRQSADPTGEDVAENRRELTMILRRKEETLRKLNLVKMYREKNNLSDLEGLISKWRSLSQTAAQDLYDKFRASQDIKITMGQFLDNMRVSHDLIRYSEEDETFS